MTYREIIEKAAKKAINALFSTLSVSDKYGHLNRPEERRYWKNKYLRELWKFSFAVAKEEFDKQDDYVPMIRKDIVSSLQEMLSDDCKAIHTMSWTCVRLANRSYIISDASDGTYVTANDTDAQVSLMTAEQTARLMNAFDEYLTNWEQEIDDALLAYSAEKQAGLVLKMTASVILKDILAENEGIDFKMKLQKIGKIRCNITSKASWLPDKVFRTTWETLREDFAAALKEYNKIQHKIYYYQ